jgi:hypothetical protein
MTKFSSDKVDQLALSFPTGSLSLKCGFHHFFGTGCHGGGEVITLLHMKDNHHMLTDISSVISAHPFGVSAF